MSEITAYHHPPVERSLQCPDPQPAPYYVSVIDGPRYGLLLGPFPRHEEALAKVEAVRRKACELDGRAHWWGFGTCRVKDPTYDRPGRFNRHGIEV